MSNLSKSHYQLSLAFAKRLVRGASRREEKPLQRRIAILLSTVVLVDLLGTSIGFSSAVSAKPRPSAPVVTSQTTKFRISPQPVEAVLANLQPKSSSRLKVGGATSRLVVKSSQAPIRQVKTDRYFQGISHLIDTDRQTDVSPVDRLIK